MDYDGNYVRPELLELYQRIRRFAGLTTNDEIRSLVWRLGEVVSDDDCPSSIAADCAGLYGLVGEQLKRQLTPLLSDYESRITRLRKSRDRVEAVRISKDMVVSDQLRDFYFKLSEDDLQTIWNNGDNELPTNEKELVRIALRDKLGIRLGEKTTPEICSVCFLIKTACVCERGWR
ncbi:MAG: hypothetical protein KA260_10100 [Burkholderiales bacterium]|nr:hypothetical protein [Burkholderiales bacterium]